VKEKVTVAITGALSGAVLLAAINSQLGSIGYTVAVEYVFYAFFVLALLCIISILVSERLRAVKQEGPARAVEWGTRVIYETTTLAVVIGILAVTRPG
jgi:ABC-type siderophore export system fused ATPase/permease subunit